MHEADERDDQARDVEALRVRVLGLRHHHEDADEAMITIGTLMRKTPPQSLLVSHEVHCGFFEQQAAEHGAERDGAAHRAAHADRLAALVRREDDGDDREGDGQHRGAADAHEAAERDELLRRRREGAQPTRSRR